MGKVLDGSIGDACKKRMEFKSRAIRSLVEILEQETRRFLHTWERFKGSGLAMPTALGDPNYADADRLVMHVLNALREDLAWVNKTLGRSVDGSLIPAEGDLGRASARAEGYANESFVAWRRSLAHITDEELRTIRPGSALPTEAILEHAIVHPMRHRIQLERILAGE